MCIEAFHKLQGMLKLVAFFTRTNGETIKMLIEFSTRILKLHKLYARVALRISKQIRSRRGIPQLIGNAIYCHANSL